MSLYSVLGVSSTATFEQIQEAYRRIAQRIHPDKGGGVDEFQKLQEAYRVLSDPEKRAKYDRFGESEKVDSRAQLLVKIAQLVQKLIDDIEHPEYTDLRAIAENSVRNKRQEISNKIDTQNRRRAKYQRVVDRFVYKGESDNVLNNIVLGTISQMDRKLDELKEVLREIDLVLEMLQEYEFKFDQPPSEQSSTGRVVYVTCASDNYSG